MILRRGQQTNLVSPLLASLLQGPDLVGRIPVVQLEPASRSLKTQGLLAQSLAQPAPLLPDTEG